MKIQQMAISAKKATLAMAKSSSNQRNQALKFLIDNLNNDRDIIFKANRDDIALAQSNGLDNALLERLSLENRLEEIIYDIEKVISLPDPIGQVYDEQTLPNQLGLMKCRTPLGVLGVIYESRPNVTLDISALTIKSGNCALLRGGSETLHTNQILVELIQKSLESAGLPRQAIQLIASTDRLEIKEMLQLHQYIDLIIPRGGSALQQFCLDHSKIPVITGGIGICHLFVDETADLERSCEVILNAKTDRPTVCNALDTLLVHEALAPEFIPRVINLLKPKGVDFRLDQKSWDLYHDRPKTLNLGQSETKSNRSEAPRLASLAQVEQGEEEDRFDKVVASTNSKSLADRGIIQDPSCQLADSKTWDTEWLSLVLGIKVVENLPEAIAHIQQHSKNHSDGILTENPQNAEIFTREIDSAAVFVNASTRFNDGGQFGMGAEVAISTQKLHARGPMGLRELTSYKWIIRGNYQIRT